MGASRYVTVGQALNFQSLCGLTCKMLILQAGLL